MAIVLFYFALSDTIPKSLLSCVCSKLQPIFLAPSANHIFKSSHKSCKLTGGKSGFIIYKSKLDPFLAFHKVVKTISIYLSKSQQRAG